MRLEAEAISAGTGFGRVSFVVGPLMLVGNPAPNS
jgi:hypothetical protein